MNKISVADIDPRMRYETICFVGPDKKYQVPFFKLIHAAYYSTIPGLLLGVVWKLNVVGGKNGHQQSGTVHAFPACSAHAMRYTKIILRAFNYLINSNVSGIQRFFGTTVQELFQPLPLLLVFDSHKG